MKKPIMVIPDEALDEVFADAMEITQAMNMDAAGLSILEERIKNFRKFQVKLDVVIYDDLSVEFRIPKQPELTN